MVRISKDDDDNDGDEATMRIVGRAWASTRRSYLKTSASRVALLFLGAIDGRLSTRTLAAGRFAFSASHC